MRGMLAWFIDNPVAANLLMIILLVGGTFSLVSMHKEEFPSIEPGIIQISVPYLGASPVEVERAVCVRIEEALEGLEGIESSERMPEKACARPFLSFIPIPI